MKLVLLIGLVSIGSATVCLVVLNAFLRIVMKLKKLDRFGRELMSGTYVKCQIWSSRHPANIVTSVADLSLDSEITLLPEGVVRELELSPRDATGKEFRLPNGEICRVHAITLKLDDDRSLIVDACSSTQTDRVVLSKELRNRIVIKDRREYIGTHPEETKYIYTKESSSTRD